MAAELRFLSLDKSGNTENSTSKDWHDRAISLCKCFLPQTCPLYQHILSSYKKHYKPRKIDGKDKSSTPNLRFYSKRLSDKPRPISVKGTKKQGKLVKTPQLLKTSPNIQKSDRKLANTGKISTKGLFNRSPHISKSDKNLTKAMLKTQKIRKFSISSDSSNHKMRSTITPTKNFVLTSNELYGDFSISSEDLDSMIIKKFSEPTPKILEKKQRTPSSTGGKH